MNGDLTVTIMDELSVNGLDESNKIVKSKKKRGVLGKILFPWKTRYGPELKKGLIKVVYLYGMHLRKGCDRLTTIKNKNDKWNYIAAEFWKQNCCQLLRVNSEFKDLQPPTGLAVSCEFEHILTEVQTAMHWTPDSMANLSHKEGDLTEYESLIKDILLEQQNQKALDELKQSQDKEKEKNEVTVLLNGLSNESDAALKVTSKAIRKRERDNTSSDEPVSSISSSGYGGSKACSYFDMMMNEIKEEAVPKKDILKSNDEISVLDCKRYQKLMIDCLQNVEWWECLVGADTLEEERDSVRAQHVGLRVIVAAFCRKPNDFASFTNEMKLLQLTYLGANKLFLFLSDTFDNMQVVSNDADVTAMTPIRK